MSKNKLTAETILISMYCDIVLCILKVHKNLSVNKTLVFSYLIKKRKFNERDVFSAKNSTDVVLKCLSQLSGQFEDYCDNIQYIIKAIHILIINKKIQLNETEIFYNCNDGESIFKESNFMNKAINQSKKITERQFLKEVINNV